MEMGASVPISRTFTTVAIDPIMATANAQGEYHRSLSKQRMNDSKYNDSGTTHKNGTAATSMQTWFVVARSMTEAAIGKANQSTYCIFVGGPVDSSAASLPTIATAVSAFAGCSITAGALRMAHAHVAHPAAYSKNAPDQSFACRGS